METPQRLWLRRQRNILCWSPLLPLAGVALLTCAPGFSAAQPPASPPLTIGLLLPPEEPEAPSLREGVMLGVEKANQAGGAQARLLIRGRVGQWGADGTEAGRLATDDQVDGFIAPTGAAATHLVLQVAGRTAIPVVSLCPDSSVTATGVPWMVRVVPGTVEEAKVLLAGLPTNAAGANRRWVAFVPKGRAGEPVGRDLAAAAKAAHWPLPKVIPFEPGVDDGSGLANLLPDPGADAAFLWLDLAPAGKLARALRNAGFAGVLAGPGRLRSPEFVKSARRASEGFVLPCLNLRENETERGRQFEVDFKLRFGHEPDVTAGMAYDAASLLLQILRKAGPEKPHRGFPVQGCTPGVTGLLAFDPRGNRTLPLALGVFRDGAPVVRSP